MPTILALLCLALGAAFAAEPSEKAQTCLACHGQAGAPAPRLGAFPRSVHKDLVCTSCHPQAEEVPHGKMPKPDCGACHAEEGAGLEGTPHGAALTKRFGSAAGACQACHGPAHGIARAHVDQLAVCGACHADAAKTPPNIATRQPVKTYLKTVHGKARVLGSTKAAACADCHGAHDIRPGLDSASRVFKTHIAATCGACHGAEAAQYRASVHGTALAGGIKEAPTCTDCHGEHTVRAPSDPESSVSSGAVTRTCAGCHASERLVGQFDLPPAQVRTFLASYHGLAAQSGHGLRVANCASCHGWHDILPSSDPASRVNPANIQATCGRCHAGAAFHLAAGKVHESLSGSGQGSRPARFFRLLYLVIIPLIIGGMLLHNFFDLAHKTFTGDLEPMRAEEEPMLTAGERVQHAALALSFTLLAVTGFALKYHFLFGGEELRRLTHRAAAVLFVALSAYHLFYLTATRAGRRRLKALLPARRDLADPFRVLAYNAGLSAERPALARFSYIEKAEYWALVWGSGVMVVTGGVLAFDSLSLRHLPLWGLECARVIHLMEAVLACLAILVWHGYRVVFDPEVYPMDWAWLTGKVRLREKGHGKGEGGA